MGKSESNDTAFVATKTGVVVGRSVKVVSDDQLVADDLLNMVGVPWKPKEGADTAEADAGHPAPVMILAPEAPEVPVIEVVADPVERLL